MAKREDFRMSTEDRRIRSFSTSFKISKVKEIQQGKTKVSEICKEYEVSATNVYRWLEKYGQMKKKTRMIVESQSDTRQILELKQRIAELEQLIGQKQILLEFKDKMIEIAEETYNIDIKKKCTSKPLNTSGDVENSSNAV